MSRLSVEELAMQLALLREKRPARFAPLDPNSTPRVMDQNPAYREHMHEEFLIEQELYRRVGIDNGNEHYRRAQQALALLSPQT